MEAKRKPIDPHITWAGDYCKHCFTCIHICPTKNLKFKDDEMVSLGKCIQCRLCEKYCPDFALEVEPKPRPRKKAPAKAAAAKKKAGAISAPAEPALVPKTEKSAKTRKKAPAPKKKAERTEIKP